MSETTHAYSHLESPAPGARLPQGRHTLRGWVWPKTGGVFCDVRARIGARLFAGVHGLPRQDLATHFNTGRPVALAEFYVNVWLEPGPVEIVLEALEIDGRWRAFQSVIYTVGPAQPPVDFAVPAGPLRWIDHGHGLRRLLHAAARQPEQPLPALARQLAGEISWPRVLRDAPAPLLGFVDEPASACCCRFGRIPAFGHLFHPQIPTRRILATVDLQSWQPLEIHRPSPGPAAHYAQFPNAQACGFTGLVDVPAQLPNPVSLRLYAELEDGSLHLGPVVRTRLHTQEDEKPLPTTRAFSFDEALAAWDAALAELGLPVTRDAELERYLSTLRVEHESTSRPRPAATARLQESPPRPTQPIPQRVLLATHGLSLQGAPRFLLELGRALAAAGASLDVVSAEDGPLRAEFEQLGARVQVLDCAAVMSADTAEAGATAVAALARAGGWASADLVIANSFTTFWAVHAAKAAQRPVLFYVHESTTPAVFYGTRVPPAVVTLAEQAFALADAVSFTTASTRRCHLAYGRPERHHFTPGWVDIAGLDHWIAAQNRDALRQALGVQPGEQLVCNIGTVSDRKGQHTFARAVDLLWRRHPELASRTRFILLGGRDTPFDTMLGDALANLGRANLVVHEETTDYLRYYLAADLFVCSSYEESSPRVVFEAMACRTPILASAVHGIPELVRDGLEAVLLPPGDTVAWSHGLARLLATPALGRELAARARARAENLFAVPAVMPRHLALAALVAAGPRTA
ncbi:glycosyltransferase [Oleiharenicola lentus]|uniref:Glycosyltransferase n=1 Tax=Oleiharenicola lentus TaxID=2508720 RepID=A0A4Q1C904_9BACT|nr:glycosyltransferase [Oleiharenicola lentus]RXK55444.1 glycosyltransferase [Oleiharenicola lentus]